MQTHPWNLIYGLGLIVFSYIRVVYGRRTKNNVKTVNRVDRLEKTLLMVLTLAYLVVPFYLCTPWLAFADYHLPEFAPWCGTVLMVAALWLFYRTHEDLGKTGRSRWSCAKATNWSRRAFTVSCAIPCMPPSGSGVARRG